MAIFGGVCCRVLGVVEVLRGLFCAHVMRVDCLFWWVVLELSVRWCFGVISWLFGGRVIRRMVFGSWAVGLDLVKVVSFLGNVICFMFIYFA